MTFLANPYTLAHVIITHLTDSFVTSHHKVQYTCFKELSSFLHGQEEEEGCGCGRRNGGKVFIAWHRKLHHKRDCN